MACAWNCRFKLSRSRALCQGTIYKQLTLAPMLGSCGRLEARGLQVLVERPVNRTEFPEYAAFDPYEAGAPRASNPGLHELHPPLL